ncbi:MAG: formate dehydrogenase accessory protein FdhE, partial [Proteobacteria bacterium]|nr:formate dehydrogenase accessory protein FdhE [Pseudomonadota bacterium]
MTDNAITPEEILARPRVAPRYLILPDRASVFVDRAARLRQLAPGHALEPYLAFVALIADAQARALAA